MTFSVLSSTNTTGNQTTYEVAPHYQVSANSLVLALVVNSHANPVTAPTITGNGLTWVKIGQTNFNTLGTPTTMLSVWRSMTNALTPSGTVSVTFGDGNQTGCNIAIVQLTGAIDTSGANGAGSLVATNFNGADATTDPNVALSALSGGGCNAVVAFFGNDQNGFAGAAETGWTEDHDGGYNTAATGAYVMHRLTTLDDSPTVTRSSTDWAGIAVEIKVTP